MNPTLLRRLRLITAAALLASSIAPARLAGQSADVRTGDRVRLDAPALGVVRLTGRVTRTTHDTLHVEVDRTGRIWPIATGLVSKLDVSLGRESRGELLKKGILSGTAAGAVIGATVGLTQDDDCRIIGGDRDCEDDADEAVGAAGIGAAIGFVVGGLYGLVRPAEQWVRVDPPIRFAAMRTRDGAWSVAMRMRLGF